MSWNPLKPSANGSQTTRNTIQNGLAQTLSVFCITQKQERFRIWNQTVFDSRNMFSSEHVQY